MGIRGTDVAKDAAAIVLQDDRFETIAAAVEEGRIVFDNIRKFVFYLFSCNLAEVLVLLAAGLAGLPLPLLPLQILWLNMVTDTFPALALAIEPGDAGVMHRPPRDPQEALLSRAFLGPHRRLWAPHRGSHARGLPVGPHLRARQGHDDELHDAGVRPDLPSRKRAQPGAGAAPRPHPVQSRRAGRRRAGGSLQLVALLVEPLARTLSVTPLGFTEWIVVVVLSAIPAIAGQTVRVRRG